MSCVQGSGYLPLAMTFHAQQLRHYEHQRNIQHPTTSVGNVGNDCGRAASATEMRASFSFSLNEDVVASCDTICWPPFYSRSSCLESGCPPSPFMGAEYSDARFPF
jgi:hypothetical protein